MSRNYDIHELKAWLEQRLQELEGRIARMEGRLNDMSASQGRALYTPLSPDLLRPAWLRTLRTIKGDFGGKATVEVLAEKLAVKRSVVSGYLSELIELGLVQRKHNHTQLPGRYAFVLTDFGEYMLKQVE